MKKTAGLICVVVILCGFTMCNRKPDNEAESLKRSQAACVSMIKAYFPEKARTVRTNDLTVASFASGLGGEQGNKLTQDWQQIRELPVELT